MKKKDLLFIFICALFFAPFFVFPEILKIYNDFNISNGMIMSFIKFGILATLGEVIGLRIKTGNYYEKGFGVIPRAIVWGILGLGIKMAFVIFGVGTPAFLGYMGLNVSPNTLKEVDFTLIKLITAFSVSVTMNIIFAPIFMTLHRITDMHIAATGGTIKGFFSPIRFEYYFVNLNWKVQWNFVFLKTIPLFWIPAHTITFLLPENHRVLFAAVLGIFLGVFLAIASIKGKKQ
ncbi:MAG TPA: Mpv17/PMP22 family protein [bacterium]|nr:Mpv17/PMP22 family protein [bacterium]HPS28832.1 Mpv17/PMP22 family protein [bacterium]